MERVNLDRIKENLSSENVIKILNHFNIDSYNETMSGLIIATVCHNPIGTDCSHKLYYYEENRMFHCYTQCGDTFDIFELIKRIKYVQGQNISFYEIVNLVSHIIEIDTFEIISNYQYNSEISNYRRQKIYKLPNYNPIVLEAFHDILPIEWLEEGIKEETLKKFKIKTYIEQNKIIIPHYDIDGELIGIRGRARDEYEIETKGKYRPVYINGKIYSHALSMNLYGIDKNKDIIKKYKTALIFEGEKSIMKADSILEENYSVANCGSSFNKNQLNILVEKLQVNEIIIAFDKEYKSANTEEGNKYFLKLYELCKKYNQYCNFSFIYDYDDLLDYKDSPADKTKEIFEILLKKRIKVD